MGQYCAVTSLVFENAKDAVMDALRLGKRVEVIIRSTEVESLVPTEDLIMSVKYLHWFPKTNTKSNKKHFRSRAMYKIICFSAY